MNVFSDLRKKIINKKTEFYIFKFLRKKSEYFSKFKKKLNVFSEF